MSNAEQQRARRRRIAAAAGRTVRPYVRVKQKGDDKRTSLLASKRAYRERVAQAEGRLYMPRKSARFDAHVSEYWKHRKSASKLHDAHVRRFKQRERDRERAAQIYAERPEHERRRASDRKHRLVEGYVIQNLLACGFPKEAITPKIIEIKREQITLRRLAIDLKKAAANMEKDNESITANP